MDKEKLKVIDGEYPDWVSVNEIELDACIADDVRVINCDTRDFAIGWQFEKPTVFKKAECNYEIWHNKGLRNLYSILKKKDNKKYSIDKKDILPWLDTLCKATGGYALHWRHMRANVKDCEGWDIKYIRFVRKEKYPDEFIVCNKYMQPVEYRKIIDNIEEL